MEYKHTFNFARPKAHVITPEQIGNEGFLKAELVLDTVHNVVKKVKFASAIV